MEDIPPSYNNINPGVLDLLPPYLNTASLVSMCSVSRAYYGIFISHLWGSPASHFVEVTSQSSRTTNGINFAHLQVAGSQNDMVYVALTRFKRILRRARLSTRQLCHTLHLPPALSEIYGGPNSTWLREVLDWLPALQSLCVSGLPFFDHESLLAVDQSRSSSVPIDPNDSNFRRYPVKLLLAAKEPNVTWIGLSLLIPHLPNLVYLDLSYTTPARNVNVLQSLEALRDLQVLKLRGIGLRDNDLEVLARAIGLRVRLLDISENQLSDVAVRTLLQTCVWLPSTQMNAIQSPNNRYSRTQFESWPVGIPPPPDSLSLDTIRTVELDEALLTQLINPLTGRLAFEDLPHAGITHLYISSNPRITIEGVRSLLDTAKLHVLDAGDVGALALADLQSLMHRFSDSSDVQGDGSSSYVRQQIAEDARQMVRLTKQSLTSNARHIKGIINRDRSRSIPTSNPQSSVATSDQSEPFAMSGAEKLIPVLREKASKNLTHLRVDHSIATSILDIQRELKEKERRVANVSELPGTLPLAAELDATNRQIQEAPGSRAYANEMSSATAIFEMDATPALPRVELPGDIIHFAISPPVGDAPHVSVDEVLSPIRGEGAMAPEVVEAPKQKQETVTTEEDDEVILNASGSGIRPGSVISQDSDSVVESVSAASTLERPAPLQIRKKSTNSELLYKIEIEALITLRPKQPAVRLHPSFLPNLRTLLLTNLPPTVPASSDLIDNLKSLITACAAEARLAALKARTNYSLPPGRARQDAERQHAKTLFALNTVVLEIDPEPEQGSQRGWKHTRQRMNISKSSTGDMDSEALWSAAENDFSFFGEEGEQSAECGIYDQEPSKYFPTIPFDEKIAVNSDEHFNRTNGVPDTPLQRFASPSTSTYSSQGSMFSPVTPISRNAPRMSDPRDLPLGRNRRISGEIQRPPPTTSNYRPPPRSQPAEVPGSIPHPRAQTLPGNAAPAVALQQKAQPQMLDVVSELAKWRRERKAAYQQAFLNRARAGSSSDKIDSASAHVADTDVYVEGYWAGEVKVIRNNKQVVKGKLERTGNVDVYGNYFEGGYLYP